MGFCGLFTAQCSNGGRPDYDEKFLEAIDFAFKKCGGVFAPKKEQLQAIYTVVTGKDAFVKAATGFGKSICYIVILYVCDYLYKSVMEASNFRSVLLIPVYVA